MKEEQPIFKVTDRRLFNADGTPRETLQEEQPEPEAKTQEKITESVISGTPIAGSEPAASAAPEPPEPSPISDPSTFEAEQNAAADLEEAGIPGAEDPASFINFAMSIASNAAASLGLMEHPVSRKREVDLELGKHWIDVLGMLQKKTMGNLSAQEAEILEGWLADLRMQFVSLTSASPPKAAGFTGRDIIGGK